MSAPIVRRATTLDLHAIHRFGTEVVHDTYDALVDHAYATALSDTWWSPAAMNADVADGRVIVAETDDALVGLVQVGRWHDEPVMWKLYVAAHQRNRGLGARLIDEAIGALPVGTERLRTEHIAANERAARFYEREGFRFDEIEGEADDPTATVWRSKAIDPLWSELVAAMDRDATVGEPMHRRIAAELGREPAAVVVDLGCGVGSMTVALAEAFPSSRVVAADSDPAMRAATRRRLTEHHLADRVDVTSVDVDDVRDLARLGSSADLVWASLVVHHQPDQEATLRGLYDIVTPGGRLVLAEGGLPMRSLPWDLGIGLPGLEVRLEAAQDEWFREMRERLDGSVRSTVGWPTLLSGVGFGRVSSQTFLVDHPAPLDRAGRDVVADRLSWAADRLAPAGLLDTGDVATVRALLDVDGPHFAGRRDDTYLLSAQTVHVAHR